MRLSATITAAFAGLAAAAPTQLAKRDYAITDCDVLNYALTLEYLERAFYRQGLSNYTQDAFSAAGITGIGNSFYGNLQVVKTDEETHVDFLNSAITAAKCPDGPVKEATYAFPSTTAKSFLTLSSVLEGVGVSAYLGAAASIMSKTYLTAAASILTIESRHSAYIRSNLKQTPFPTSFDTPLDFNEVFTLASPFIAAFANGDTASANLAKKLKPFPKLIIPPSDYPAGFAQSTLVKFFDGIQNQLVASGKVTTDTPIYAAFFSGVQGPYIEQTHSIGGGNLQVDTIPKAAVGQVYVVLTTQADPTMVSDDNILAGPAIIEVGPETPSQ